MFDKPFNIAPYTALETQLDEHGREHARPRLTPHSDNTDKHIDCLPQAVMPVVFIPGIMGTNLKRAGNNGASVWRPPNTDGFVNKIDALLYVASYLFKGAEQRQKELNPAKVEIDPDGPIDAGGIISTAEAHRRNWGAAVLSFYQPMLAFVQSQLNYIMWHGELKDWWRGHAAYQPSEYGDEKHNPPLTLTDDPGEPPFGDLDFAAHHYRFEVWVGGYNWLQSNRDSANDIRRFIDHTVLAAYAKHCNPPDKVILVTHSMGGLTSRALTEILNYDKVLGVVHGAQPATGAPATYHHMRAGYPGMTSAVVTGRNAAEVTAVSAHAPGALELLPFANYHSGRSWLKLKDHSGRQTDLIKNGDPFTEVYQSEKWYGLVPRMNTQYLTFGEKQKSSLHEDQYSTSSSRLVHSLNDVSLFQNQLTNNYFEPTYAFYGADNSRSQLAFFGNERVTYGEVVWQADGPLGHTDPDKLEVADDDGNGTITLTNGTRLHIKSPNTPGDGTVPQFSGAAPGQAGVKASFRIGNQGSGDRNTEIGFEHAQAFNDDRARWATLYAILKIVHSEMV